MRSLVGSFGRRSIIRTILTLAWNAERALEPLPRYPNAPGADALWNLPCVCRNAPQRALAHVRLCLSL